MQKIVFFLVLLAASCYANMSYEIEMDNFDALAACSGTLIFSKDWVAGKAIYYKSSNTISCVNFVGKGRIIDGGVGQNFINVGCAADKCHVDIYK